MRIFKNISIVLLIMLSLLVLTGCGKSEPTNQVEDEPIVGVDEGLINVEITIPAGFIGDQTQEDLTAIANENGYESITLNSDGSATYKMNKLQHKKMMKEMYDGFKQSLNEMIGSEDYPNFTEIEFNDNFTDFTIKTKSKELDINESFSVMAFYMYGGMYNLYSGEEIDNVHVKFVNSDSGETISESNSKDAESEE